jgi:hypothetical protein
MKDACIYGKLPNGRWFIAHLEGDYYIVDRPILDGDMMEERAKAICEVYNKRDNK